MLEVREVDVFYGGIQALRSASLSVNHGEIVALLGANGAGKSTTLMTISGILRPRSGVVHWDGEPIHTASPTRIVRMGIAQVPEGRLVFPRLTVLENLKAGAVTRRSPASVKANLDRVFSLFPRLHERLHQDAGTLSGGEQQMLAIGRALMSEPRLLLLDEPSLGIAPNLAEQIFETLAEINRSGIMILLVEQHVRAALALAHRAYVLQTGRVVLEGASDVVAADERIHAAYLGGADLRG